jgi:Family of unknown function (DUF6636)
VIAAVVALLLSAHSAATLPKLVHFESPSGNINCIGQAATSGSPAYVQCLVKTSTWPVERPKPARCDLDWDPQSLALANRRVSVGSCRGDIGPLCIDPADPCFTLGYGRSVEIGPIRCTSAATGVTCRYRTAPRVGFRVARERYLLYRS